MLSRLGAELELRPQVVLAVKNARASAGKVRDVGSIPGLGRSPGEGNGNLHQDSCLGNPMDSGAWLSTVQETRVRALGWEDPLEKEMEIHSSTLAWKIPWTEEPGRLQSMGSQRIGHD